MEDYIDCNTNAFAVPDTSDTDFLGTNQVSITFRLAHLVS